MPNALIDDELWERIEPLLPKRRPRNRRDAGRAPIPDRAVLTGILFVLRSGIPWNMLPREMGCGSGTTCWRRLVRWQRAGVWKRLHTALLTELRRRGQLDLGYDSQPHRDQLQHRGIASHLAKRRTLHGSGLGQTRWVVERTLAWLHRFRRLAVRYERRPCIHEAFLSLACSLVCWYLRIIARCPRSCEL